jgi:hypothetical protein
MSQQPKIFLSSILILFISACQQQPEPGNTPSTPAPSSRAAAVQRENVDVIAKSVVADVAQVPEVSQGTKGAPILVIEDNHASRGGRLEAAIVLNRLRNNHKVTQIGLEGSVKENPPIDAKWFFAAAKNQLEAGPPVAVNLLREGEINSAEFMELVYDNIEAVPIETQKEYEVKAAEDGNARAILITHLYELAFAAPRPEHKAKLEKILRGMKDPDGDETTKEKQQDSTADSIFALKPSEWSADPWIKEASDKLFDKTLVLRTSLKDEIALYEGIQRRFEEKFGKLRAEDKQQIEDFLKYLKAREAANNTMVDATSKIADRPDVYAVAMIVGAAHTQGVSALLKADNRPFAVIRPNFLNVVDDPTSLSTPMYTSKLNGNSVYAGELTETISKAAGRLPQPVLQQRWFDTKAELYLYTERITQKYFPGGGGKPPGDGGSPPIFGSDDFDGDFVRIDPTQIKLVKDEEGSNVYAVVFPAQINPKDPSLTQTVWVKAGRSGERLPASDGKEVVEKMLKEALDNVKKEKPKSGKDAHEELPKLEGESGRIKITRETTAAFAKSEADVMKKSVIVRS